MKLRMRVSNKYFDEMSMFHILGNLINKPHILSEKDKYFFLEEDFYNPFYTSIFGAINNMYVEGAKSISVLDIENYLSNRPGLYGIYNQNKGTQFLMKATETATETTFDYYYNRMRKLSMLREFVKIGVKVEEWYDPDNFLDVKLKEKQENWLTTTPVNEIMLQVTTRIDEIKDKYMFNVDAETEQAGTGLFDLIMGFKEAPDVGVPMYGTFVNSVLRGARLKKYYLRSAPTGVGKSRSMVADACYIGANEIYDLNLNRWVKNGTAEPTSMITTELELDEVRTMMVAFIAGVEEDSILNYQYKDGELERVEHAIKVLQASKIQITQLPDFSLQDIENVIKKHNREFGTKYVFFDYIHSSLKIMEEITKRTGGMKLREDQILFMISIRLKDLCNELGIFIMSATQVNGDWMDADEPNQNLLRGAKAIADKIDAGMIILPATQDDLKSLQPLLDKGLTAPTHFISVYKNRRGKFKSVRLWCYGQLGMCRLDGLFITDHHYNLIQVDDLQIEVEDDKHQPINFEDEEIAEVMEYVF